MKKIHDKKIAWAIALFIVAVLILNAITFYASKRVYQIEELDMFITVNNYTGFNVDTGAISFGTIPNSGKATRIVRIANSDSESNIILSAEGAIAKWVILPNSTINVKAGEILDLPLSVLVPPDAEIGHYSGKLKIRFLKP